MTEFDSMQEAFDSMKAKYDRKRSHNRFTDGVLDLTISEQDISSIVDDYGNNDNIVSTNYAGIPFISTVKENKGSGSVPDYNSDDYKDHYDRYNDMLEPDADMLLINSGATIIYSNIELTDSSGSYRTIVRRQDDRGPKII